MSQEVIDLLKVLSKAHVNNSQRIDDIEDELNEIQEHLQKIFNFIEFHLGKSMPMSSEASSTISAVQDSPQVDKQNESSPSSQELPDHKNPPSQT